MALPFGKLRAGSSGPFDKLRDLGFYNLVRPFDKLRDLGNPADSAPFDKLRGLRF